MNAEVIFKFITMKYIWIILFAFFFTSCKENKQSISKEEERAVEVKNNTANTVNIDLEIYDFNGFKKYLNQKDDKVYIVNFWATWCGPCVKELPYFERINKEYGNKNVEVILVSLDFPHLYESKLKPFILEHHIKSKVIALDDVDMNTWIPLVNPDWSGSIPATIIYKNDTSKFFEQSFTYEILENETLKFLK